MKATLKRICAGYYTVTRGERTAVIDHREDLNGWVVRAEWDQFLYSDTINSYKEAKADAISMLDFQG